MLTNSLGWRGDHSACMYVMATNRNFGVNTYSIGTVTPSTSHIIICSRSILLRLYALQVSDCENENCTVDLIRTTKPHNTPVVACNVDKTGSLLATGGTDGTVKVWDIRGGFVTHSFHGHGGLVSSVLFFQMATTSDVGRKARKNIRRALAKSEENRLKGLSSDERALVFCLASASEDGIIKIWDLPARKCLSTLDSHFSLVRGLAYSRENNILVSSSRDRTIMIWNALTWELKSTISVLEEVESCGLLSGGSIIYCGGEHGRVRLFRTADGSELTQTSELTKRQHGITDIIHNEKLSYLFIVQSDQTFSLYSVGEISSRASPGSVVSLLPKRRIFGTHDEIIDLAYVGEDRSMLALATNVEHIRIISIKGDLKDNTRDEGIQWVEKQGFGAEVDILEGHKDIIISLDVDWSGNWLVTGAKDNTARIWRLNVPARSHECYAVLTGHAEAVGAVAFPKLKPSSDSQIIGHSAGLPPPFVITGSQDQTVKRWDVTGQKEPNGSGLRSKYTRKAHERDINAVDIMHNGTLFASASQDRTAKIWDAVHGESIGVLRGHKRGVWSIKFSPKDTPIIAGSTGGSGANRGFILTGSGDRSVKVWSLSDYSCLLTLEGHTNSVLKAVWLSIDTSDTRERRSVFISSSGGDGLVKVWNLSIGQVACTLDNHTDRVWALTTKPNSDDDFKTQIISGGGDGFINFWIDKTSEAINTDATAQVLKLEQEQRLDNLTSSGNLREAILLALQLNHPARLFSILSSFIESQSPRLSCNDQPTLVNSLDNVLVDLSDEQLLSLLARVRDWNVSARTAPVAQKVLWALVKCYPASKFVDLRAWTGRKDGTLRDVLDALKAYTERHYRRIEDMIDESFMLEYTLLEMNGFTSDGNAQFERQKT